MDVFETDGTPIIVGRRCVVGWPLLSSARYRTTVPAGELMAFDTARRQVDPVLEDFGSRVLLLYLDAAETASL